MIYYAFNSRMSPGLRKMKEEYLAFSPGVEGLKEYKCCDAEEIERMEAEFLELFHKSGFSLINRPV